MRRYIYALLLALGLGRVQAQEALHCTWVGASEGACRAVAAQAGEFQQGLTLIGAGTQLVALYNFDPENLLRSSALGLPDLIHSIVLDDTLAYVADGLGGLQIINVSDPSEMQVLGVLDVGDYVLDVKLQGQRAYLANNWSGLGVVDISNPRQPLLLSETQTYGAQAVDVQGSLAYIADREAGLRLFDVSNPNLPVELSHLGTPGISQDVAVRDSLVYMADGNVGLRVVNAADPRHPEIFAGFNTRGNACGLALLDSMLYVADRDSGLCILSLEVLEFPHEVGFYDSPGSTYAVSMLENLAYLADDQGGLRVVDVTNPAFAGEVGAYEAPGYAHSLALQDDQAFLVDGWAGSLGVIGLGPWGDLPELGTFAPDEAAWDLDVQGTLGVAAAGWAGLLTLDVSNPANIIRRGSFVEDGFMQAVTLVGDTAYCVSYMPPAPPDPEYTIFYMVDVRNRVHPVRLGLFLLPGHAYGLDVVDNLVYVACGREGLHILDVGFPAFTTELSFHNTPGVAHNVDVVGGTAYLADGLVGHLRMIDVTDPEAPFELGVFNTASWSIDVAVQDSVAFVADFDSGLRIVDVRDPGNPVEIAYYDTPGHALGVEVVNDMVYLADDEAGLQMIEFDRASGVEPSPEAPADFTLSANVPNPFNPRTVIHYSLGHPQEIRLTVYDLAGRRVRELFQGWQGAGPHQAVFDGQALPSGVYLCKLATDAGSHSLKMLLIK